MVSRTQISDADSAEEAARKTRNALRTIAEEEFGQDGELEVSLRQNNNKWIVSWPAGPYEWTTKITEGQTILGGERAIQGFGQQDTFVGEIKNQDELVFIPE